MENFGILLELLWNFWRIFGIIFWNSLEILLEFFVDSLGILLEFFGDVCLGVSECVVLILGNLS